MSFFPNDKVTIYEEKEDDSFGLDSYGNPKKGLIEVATVYGDLQPMSNREYAMPSGEAQQSQFKIFFKKDTPITETSKLKIEGHNRYFAVNGVPEIRNTLIPHIKCYLIIEDQIMD